MLEGQTQPEAPVNHQQKAKFVTKKNQFSNIITTKNVKGRGMACEGLLGSDVATEAVPAKSQVPWA